MRSILEELFYGNVCPNTVCRSADKETKELMGYVADHHDTLLKELTDKQKEILEKFDDCYNELTDINEREIFVYAFRLGARIAIEVLSHDRRRTSIHCSRGWSYSHRRCRSNTRNLWRLCYRSRG
ncbi:MAG: hypothetical protein IJZ08_06225 [Clostridia bacterium]|nr:hypothetical protein [Clostridia bacterium]